MVEVERLCDRVVFVSGGRVVADGTAEEVATRFGRDDLEGVFLHLADEAEDQGERPRRRYPATQRTGARAARRFAPRAGSGT